MVSKRVYHALLLAVAAPLGTLAETNRSWDQLARTIEEGKKVVVTRMDGQKVEGKLIRVSGDAITVHWRKQDTEVARGDVRRVRYADKRRRNTLIGLAAGAAIGVIPGVKSGYPELIGVTAAVLGGVGSAVGGLMPIGKPLYEIEKPGRPR